MGLILFLAFFYSPSTKLFRFILIAVCPHLLNLILISQNIHREHTMCQKLLLAGNKIFALLEPTFRWEDIGNKQVNA